MLKREKLFLKMEINKDVPDLIAEGFDGKNLEIIENNTTELLKSGKFTKKEILGCVAYFREDVSEIIKKVCDKF